MPTKVVITEHEKARRSLGLSATAMARALGLVDHSYISHIERGAVKASPRYRAKACRLLQAAEDELFDAEGFVR